MIVVGLSGGMEQGKSTVGKLLRKVSGAGPKTDLEFSYPISEVLNLWMANWPQPLSESMDVVDLANQLIDSLLPILNEKTGKHVTKEHLMIERTEASLARGQKLLDYLKRWRQAGDNLNEVYPTPIVPANKYLHRELLQWLGGNTVTQVDDRIWADVVGRRIDTLEGRGEPLVTVGGVRFKGDADVIHEHKGVVLRVVRPDSRQSNDVTESARQDWEADITVLNNGTLAQLEACVNQLWKDLSEGKTQSEYSAN